LVIVGVAVLVAVLVDDGAIVGVKVSTGVNVLVAVILGVRDGFGVREGGRLNINVVSAA